MLQIILTDSYISVSLKPTDLPINEANSKHKAIATMLGKANFQQTEPGMWRQEKNLEKWYAQCQLLVDKVGGEVIDKRGEAEETENKNDKFVVISPPPLEDRISLLEAEVKRLGELGAIASEELSKLEKLLQNLLR